MLGLSKFLQKIQIWEQCVLDNVQNEVDLLKSWTNISETLLKKKQLDLFFPSTEFQQYWLDSWANTLRFEH